MMIYERKERLLYWGITVVLMIVIFLFSAKTGDSSSKMSIGYAKVLAKLLGRIGIFDVSTPALLMMHAESVHTFVRKMAHFTEYAVLGFFSYQAITCDLPNSKKSVITAQILCTSYAITDEIHQIFVPGREGKVFDVGIDSFGALTGIILAHFLFQYIEYHKESM
ncbi:VanZ family protein [Anaerostipes faecalis]|uniref:VanZ family protein n=1 Tax=Anaerostipes faecalis TaxID=2738446 RepID=UPI001C1E3692|nr:VanZ family protein [Anaerostipes faecalis]